VVLYFVFKPQQSVSLDQVHLEYTPTGGAAIGPLSAAPIKSVISTRANAWGGLLNKSVSGKWNFSFKPLVGDPQTAQKMQRLRELFDGKRLDDILLVISYSGRTSAWPQ
jgi:hypothetical protein